MKSLRNHIPVILTLFVLLFSIQFSMEIYKIIQEQNSKLKENYSIVLVSQNRLKIENLQKVVNDIQSIEIIKPKKILDKLKNSMSPESLTMLKIALPYFYSAKLNKLPTKSRLKKIKNSLLSIKGISRVEIFSKTYDSIYQILKILQFITYAFNIIIFFMSALLLFKQIKIWILEHEEKIKIMGYFGANYWIKSGFLYKIVLIDSMVAVFLVGVLFNFISISKYVKDTLLPLGISFPNFTLVHDLGILFLVALISSLFIVAVVSRKMDK